MVHDIVVIGGGIAGSSVAIAARQNGLSVLVLEAETAFRDRIRGEGLHCWGVAEAEKLGISELLYASCARSLPWWDVYLFGEKIARRDLRQSIAGCESMSFFHPDMQAALLAGAEKAGATVRRGTVVAQIETGATPTAIVAHDGAAPQRFAARHIVLASGRGTSMRSMLGLTTKRGAHGLKTTGVLLDHVDPGDDAVSMFFAPTLASASPLFPLPGRRARVYLAANPAFDDKSYSGATAAAPLFARLSEVGVLDAWLREARVAGPLATFDGTPTWAEGTWPQGVTLVGDVAGSLDPAFGSGLSLALLDARTFTEKLAAGGAFDAASRAYAQERVAYYAKLLRLESWVSRVLYGVGADDGVPHPELLPRLTELEVDLIGGGPHCRIDDAIERQLFGVAPRPG
jgi:2-polyprenyl-6-methoxyphenol hydroxylase-like FAD-dependent oxidoreductase